MPQRLFGGRQLRLHRHPPLKNFSQAQSLVAIAQYLEEGQWKEEEVMKREKCKIIRQLDKKGAVTYGTT